MIWKVILECNDDDDNPTVWAAEVNSRKYGKFIWIFKIDEKEFEIISSNYKTPPLIICKSLTSAKRWCTMNIR